MHYGFPEAALHHGKSPGNDAVGRLPVFHGFGGRRSGRCRTKVRHEVCDRRVGFVSHARNHRCMQFRNNPRKRFFVIGPEVSEGPPAPHEQNNVTLGTKVRVPERRAEFGQSALSLHPRGIKDDVNGRARKQNRAHRVTQCRGFGTCDNADAPRVQGERFFARNVKKAFGKKLFL